MDIKSTDENDVRRTIKAVPRILKNRTDVLNPNDDGFNLIYPIVPVKRFRSNILMVISAPANKSIPSICFKSDGYTYIVLSIKAAIPIIIPAQKDFKIVFSFLILSTPLN